MNTEQINQLINTPKNIKTIYEWICLSNDCFVMLNID